MDREKAIQILKRCEAESHCEHYKRHYCCIGCGQREALDLAIEALKEPTGDYEFFGGTYAKEGDAEPATTTDCISRQQAIEALTGWQTEPLDEDIVRTLESLPPVTPTVSEDCISRQAAINALQLYLSGDLDKLEKLKLKARE